MSLERERENLNPETKFKPEHSVVNNNFITRASMTSRDLFGTK